jgi:CheY-like chemotaxis protein
MPRRALVVDDDALTRELLASMLEDLGCDTLTARSGTDALTQLANDHRIDLLITDINMPGLSGTQLALRARQFRRSSAIGLAAAQRCIALLNHSLGRSLTAPMIASQHVRLLRSPSILMPRRGAGLSSWIKGRPERPAPNPPGELLMTRSTSAVAVCCRCASASDASPRATSTRGTNLSNRFL